MPSLFRNPFFYLLILCSALAGFLYVSISQFLFSPMAPSATETIAYVIPEGSNLKLIATDLEARGLLSSSFYFVWIGRLEGVSRDLHIGEYPINNKISAQAFLMRLKTGKVMLHKITFIEGWTLAKVLATLQENPALSHPDKPWTEADLLKQYQLTYPSAEGLFFPDTYHFTRGTPESVILKKSFELMQQKLEAEWQNRSPNLLYKNAYQALIAASLIERETAQDNERPEIAGVMLRRIQKGMPLQIDASVIYGLGDQYDGKLSYSDLKIPTPYNTYLNYGWPPTPIALPSQSSLHAALHPSDGTSLYYVAKGDGTHAFSDTLAEQNAMIAKYRENKNE